jgi:hypothetical protein
MIRRTLAFAAVLTIMLGGLFVATQEAAVAAPIATGTATCPVVGGSGTVNPGLSAPGSPGSVKITYKATIGHPGSTILCGGTVTSPTGVLVVGGTVTGSGYYNPPTAAAHGSSCVNFDGPDKVGVIKETIVWATIGGPIANTNITYTGDVASTTGPLNGFDTLTLKAPYGVKTAGSSFHVPALPVTSKFVTTLPAPGTHCVGTTTAFKITGGAVAM